MKKILVFTLLFYLTLIQSAYAHTGLENSSPQNGEVIKQELKQITLTFETKVEQGSTLELQNSTGEPVLVENIALSENEMVGSLKDPLKNGEYIVNWNIIGADGHPIEGQYTFSVDVPVTEVPTPAEDQVESADEAQPQSTVEKKKTDTVNETATEDVQQNKLPSYIVPVIIVILAIVVVGSFLFMMKRKK
ncbi:hypothetical protein HHO41_13055 [Bacillus sp. DNRA2]|uniref:copper resistance protein CopC n=1 Tax=Bacillus sp. DNRA2 TaxID=2723053 RepID=UPI00145E0130|nr:hypothetical protein [Bacillus sp. DNRA2]